MALPEAMRVLADPAEGRHGPEPNGAAERHGVEGAAKEDRSAKEEGRGVSGPGGQRRAGQARDRVQQLVVRGGAHPLPGQRVGETVGGKGPGRDSNQAAGGGQHCPRPASPTSH